ncbi:hypothetical protein [Nocardia crassostreae]|uniref:hypothetical protein n=1 Tax=Nocardia crassostreae TaxID=53428 RepID=UPI000B193DAB|nr:hypothetical protein [Nocardia crassostreae]
MPDLAVTLMVILGFLAACLCLRALAAAEARHDAIRAPRAELRAGRAMISE